MSNDVIEIDSGRKNLLNNLNGLLEEHIKEIHGGNTDGRRIDSLNEQTRELVTKIVETGILELEESIQQKEKLRKLYNILNLAVIAQKDETAGQIKQIRKGKKTIDLYRCNI